MGCINEINGHTKLTGLLGSPVAHSKSPLMHNEAFKELGLNYVYLCFDVPENNLKIAVAESCTGGMVSSALIDYPGISSVFMEGCVTYSNEAKVMSLGVKEETLNTVGAVSEECAKEMAEGVAKRHNTNIGLSTTGIAGPQGGTTEKPVGLVYMGITINNKTIVKKYIFNGDRQQIRSRACKTLLNDLRLELLNI